MHQVLRIARNPLRTYWNFHVLFAFGLLGLPVLCDERDHQDLLEVGLVRAQHFQFPLDFHIAVRDTQKKVPLSSRPDVVLTTC